MSNWYFTMWNGLDIYQYAKEVKEAYGTFLNFDSISIAQILNSCSS